MKKIICLLTALLSAATVSAQINQLEFIRFQYFKPSVHAKLWTFGDGAGLKKYAQVAAPVTYSMALGSRFGVDVITSPFVSVIEQTDKENVYYYNLSDTFVRGSLMLGNNLALLTVGVGVPTGETSLETKELAMAGLAANRPLNNPVASFGSGSSISVGLAVAQEVNSWVVGLGAGYTKRNKYEADFNNSIFKIKPGNELNLTVGVEREFDISNGKGKVLADLIYTNYTEDDLNGQPFEAGDKILARGQIRLPLGILNPIILSATQRWRLDNTATNSALISNGNELDLRATIFLPAGKTFSLKSVVKAQIYSNTLNDAEGATIYGFGGGFVLNLARHFSFDPTFIYLKGTLNTGPDTEIDITGLEATGGFAFRF